MSLWIRGTVIKIRAKEKECVEKKKEIKFKLGHNDFKCIWDSPMEMLCWYLEVDTHQRP